MAGRAALVMVFVTFLAACGSTGFGEEASIATTASTNSAAWTLTVREDGSADQAGRPGVQAYFPRGSLATAELFGLLRRIGDVSLVGSTGCLKSASFGTRTTIEYHGTVSKDLQCIDPKEPASHRALGDAVQRLAKQAFLANPQVPSA